MSTQMTKQTLTALERTDFVINSIRTQKSTVTAELNLGFGEALPEGIPQPDWDSLQESHVVRLEGSIGGIRQTEREHRQNLARMSALRKQRRTIVDGLLGEYRKLRSSVDGNYPAEGLIVLGIENPPVRRFAAVREQMPEILGLLRDPDLAARMPEPRPGHAALDFESFAVPMESGIQALEESMETIQEMRKILDESLLAKREALEENRRIYLNLARIQEGYYRLAGLDDLADRIRTEVYRVGGPRRSSTDGEPTDTPPSDDTSTESSGAEARIAATEAAGESERAEETAA